MPCIPRSFVRLWILPALAVMACAGIARAQDDPWLRLVSEADSIGPETPRIAPSRWAPCATTSAADSVRVAPSDEFLFGARSLRTRGMFTYDEVPDEGSGTFALRAILCDESGRPLTFVLERDHRHFYLVFSLRAVQDYRALTLFTKSPRSCFRWAEERGRFVPVACPGTGEHKC